MLPFPFDRQWTLGAAAELACLLEASAAKIGNVHPTASFSDMHFSHFLASAVASGPVFAQAAAQSVGSLILAGVRATRTQVGRNTNLGTLLLFAPLAKAYALRRTGSSDQPCTRLSNGDWRSDVHRVLEQLTPADSTQVYQAIQEAQPNGLGTSDEHDVAGTPPDDLRIAMAVVANVDAVARQYVNDFEDIFLRLVPWLYQELQRTENTLEAICRLQLRWLAYEPDGLIVRKAGKQIAQQVHLQAEDMLQVCLQTDLPLSQQSSVRELDLFLRADGHRRNPGTTADLLAAALLVALLGKSVS